MEDNQLRQDYFISDDGYINLRLKVLTEDKEEREKIVAELMVAVYKGKGIKISELTSVDQLYFHNQNPLTVLKTMKEEMLSNIENLFDSAINR